MRFCDDNLHRAYGEHAMRAREQGFQQVPYGWFREFHAGWILSLYP